jgi:hypothetical protein
VADLGHRSRIRGGIVLGAVVASAIAIPAALFPVMPGAPVFAAALAIFLFCGTVAGLALTAVIAVDLPNEIRGLSFGAFLAVGGLIGYGVTPTIVTMVSSLMGGERNLAPALALVGSSISVLVFLSFLLAMRAAPMGGAEP